MLFCVLHQTNGCRFTRILLRCFEDCAHVVSGLNDICSGSQTRLVACELYFLMSAVGRPVTPRLWSGFLVWLLYMVPIAPSRMV